MATGPATKCTAHPPFNLAGDISKHNRSNINVRRITSAERPRRLSRIQSENRSSSPSLSISEMVAKAVPLRHSISRAVGPCSGYVRHLQAVLARRIKSEAELGGEALQMIRSGWVPRSTLPFPLPQSNSSE